MGGEGQADAARGADLSALAPEYFQRGSDPLAAELGALAEAAGQAEVDAVVERLTGALEVVSGQLKRHVVQHQEKLIQGLTNVTGVGDDVQAAFCMAQAARRQLRGAADDVAAQVAMVEWTRKKQRLMGALDLATRLQQVWDLPANLKPLLEAGEFGDAVLQCLEAHQLLEAGLSALAAAPQLRARVKRHYYDCLSRLDAALQRTCAAFCAEAYSKLLEAYLLSGTQPPALAAKVGAAYPEALHDAALRVVRGALLATKGVADGAGAGLLLEAGSYPQMCRQLPAKLLRPCLLQLLELVYDVLASYEAMHAFHEACGPAAEAAAAAAAAAARASSSGDEGAGVAPDAAPAAEQQLSLGSDQMAGVHAATRALLCAVGDALRTGRDEVVGAVGAKVRELLLAPDMARGDEFLQVVGWCEALAAFGDAMVAGKSELRAALTACYTPLLEGHHRCNMEGLRALLAAEQWGAAPAAAGSAPGIERALRGGALAAALAEWGGRDLRGWLELGNPFAGEQAAAQQPADAAPGPAPAPRARVATASSRRVACWLRNYAELFGPLPALRDKLWRCVAELFDNYLLACWVLFGGVTLEALAWQDDCAPHRLRSALLRITTSEGCKYKAAVEELLRNKPAPKPAAPASAAPMIDFGLGLSRAARPAAGRAASPAPGSGGAAGGSKFDAFTKRFKETVVELINADLSQPYEGAGGSRGATPPPLPLPPTAAGGSGASTPRVRPDRSAPAATSSPRPQLQPQAQAAAQQQQQQQPQSGAPSPSPPPPAAAASPPANVGVGGRWGLRERVVAVESLMAIADDLKAAKPALMGLLCGGGPAGSPPKGQQQQGTAPPAGQQEGQQQQGQQDHQRQQRQPGQEQEQEQQQQHQKQKQQDRPAGLAREVESYFSRTVDAAGDLRDAIFSSATRQLLQAVLDPDRGAAAQIAAAGYAARAPASSYQPWAEAALRELRGFAQHVAGAELPGDLLKQMWEHAARLVLGEVLEGFSRCRRCSVEGRAAMSLDLGHLEKGMRALLPPGAAVAGSVRLVDGYIKAFYMPWEELPRWAQLHLAEYGRAQILTLIDAMAEAYGVKRAARAAMAEQLSAELGEFA